MRGAVRCVMSLRRVRLTFVRCMSYGQLQAALFSNGAGRPRHTTQPPARSFADLTHAYVRTMHTIIHTVPTTYTMSCVFVYATGAELHQRAAVQPAAAAPRVLLRFQCPPCAAVCRRPISGTRRLHPFAVCPCVLPVAAARQRSAHNAHLALGAKLPTMLGDRGLLTLNVAALA